MCPIYKYSCSKCEKIEEVIKPMSECNSKELCPDCGTLMEKQITLPAATVWNCELDTSSGGKPTINNGAGFSNYKLGKWIDKAKQDRSKDNEARRKKGREKITKQRERSKKSTNKS